MEFCEKNLWEEDTIKDFKTLQHITKTFLPFACAKTL